MMESKECLSVILESCKLLQK